MRNSKKSQYKEVAERVIYLLLFHGTKDFFIFHCPKKAVRDYFRQHMHGTHYKTMKSIEELKKQDLHPCLFVLEEVNTTKVDAFNYVIVWTKIFTEAGYTGLDHGNVNVYKDDLFDHNVILYDERKNADLSSLLTCEYCLVKIYNRTHCRYAPDYIEPIDEVVNKDERPKGKKQVAIRLPQEECEQIKRNAHACNQSVSEYVKQNALDMKVIKPDLSIISECTAEIHEHVAAVIQLIYTIKRRDDWVTADLEYILEETKTIYKLSKKLLQRYENHIETDVKRMKKDVREHVKKRILANSCKKKGK